MALVNKKANKNAKMNSRKLSQAVEDSRFNTKYFETTEKILRRSAIKRVIASHSY